MKIGYGMTVGLLGLAACGEILSEASSTIMVDGRPYELRTRVIDGPDGPFEQSSVIVRNRPYICRAQSPNDCEATVRLARSASESGD